MFSVTVLGCGSAAPAKRRWPASQIIGVHGSMILIDCGEGTQFLLRKHKVKFQRIDTILISHLHGDHYFGLPGLLSTMNLLGRVNPLVIFGPVGLESMVRTFLGQDMGMAKFKVEYREVSSEETILDNEDFSVSSIELNHRIPCFGFVLKEKERPRKIISKKVEGLGLPKFAYRILKAGQDVELENGVVRFEDVTEPAPSPRSYAYCSDTAYTPALVDKISGVDSLYHEATFKEDLEDVALKTGHSTASQAAQIAKAAGVGKLIIGHYSSRYFDLEELHAEAKNIFPNTILGEEGLEFKV